MQSTIKFPNTNLALANSITSHNCLVLLVILLTSVAIIVSHPVTLSNSLLNSTLSILVPLA